MNMDTLCDTLSGAIHDDSTLQTWCTTNFGRNHKVYYGYDPRKPPDEGEYPLVSLRPLQKVSGYDLERQDHVVMVTCGIHDDDLETGIKANEVKYESMGLIGQMTVKVVDAVQAASLSGLFIAKVIEDYNTIEFFPFLLCDLTITFSREYAQGDDPLT